LNIQGEWKKLVSLMLCKGALVSLKKAVV
jgi:hypothetical protein